MSSTKPQLQSVLAGFNDYLKSIPEGSGLTQAMHYSLKQEGGKRFRPMLSILMAEHLGLQPRQIYPFALAVERVHTYSLIHDDLPCMDNDDFRRGKPTNHKVFGESTALLAGDALLTDCFFHLAKNYADQPKVGLLLVEILSEAAGSAGMALGQFLDLQATTKKTSSEELWQIHKLKTGCLIRASVEGAAVVANIPITQRQIAREFGELVGLAFQIKDDLLDYNPEKLETCSLVASLGIAEAKEQLQIVTTQAVEKLSLLGEKNKLLQELVIYNFEREN